MPSSTAYAPALTHGRHGREQVRRSRPSRKATEISSELVVPAMRGGGWDGNRHRHRLHAVIARRQPTAIDLRMVMSAGKVKLRPGADRRQTKRSPELPARLERGVVTARRKFWRFATGGTGGNDAQPDCSIPSCVDIETAADIVRCDRGNHDQHFRAIVRQLITHDGGSRHQLYSTLFHRQVGGADRRPLQECRGGTSFISPKSRCPSHGAGWAKAEIAAE